MDGTPLALGGRRQRSLLAALALHANETVSVDRLLECVWPGGEPATARHLVHTYVSQLRSALGTAVHLRTEPPGYVLEAQAEQVDAAWFEARLRAAQARRYEPATALALVEEALALWRGPVAADVELGGDAAAAAGRLDELRLLALEARADAALALGRHAELVQDLQRLVAAEPLRERFREQLMLALYRSGRQSDALAAYRAARRHLAAELGVEPGPELRRLERAILDQDPSLEPALPPEPPARDPPPRRRRKRRLLVGGGLVGVLVAAAIATAAAGLVGGGGNGAPALGPGEVGVLDASSGRVLAAVPAGVVPSALAVAPRAVWVADGSRDAVVEVDGATGRVVRTVRLNAPPHALAVAGDALWVADGFDGKLQRVEAGAASRPLTPTPTSRGRLALTADARSLWVASQDGYLDRIDVRTRRVAARVRVGLSNAVASDGTGVWIAAATRAAVLRVDPRTNRVVRTIPIGGIPRALAVGAGSIWATTAGSNRVWRIDPRQNAVVAAVAATDGSGDVAVAGGRVWVASTSSPVVVAIDPATDRVVATIQLASPVLHLAGDGTRLWLTLAR